MELNRDSALLISGAINRALSLFNYSEKVKQRCYKDIERSDADEKLLYGRLR
jgi:hypothetical protein